MSAIYSAPVGTRFKVAIAPEIIRDFPDAKVAFLIARIQLGKLGGDAKGFMTHLKQRVVESLIQKEITPDNYRDLPVCKSWQKVYHSFKVDGDKASTIENLLRRWTVEARKVQNKIAKKPDVGTFNNFVDYYNCISVNTLTPMGALDLSKIQGDIVLRYGKRGEMFTPLGGRDADPVSYEVQPEHVVYADDRSILTWLWNYRDAQHACVPKESEEPRDIVLFADEVERGAGNAELAISEAQRQLAQIGGKCLFVGGLTSHNREISCNLEKV